MEKRIYSLLTLDQHYVENFEAFDSKDKVVKAFKKSLRDRGIGIIKQRKYITQEFFREGDFQIQLIKSEIT